MPTCSVSQPVRPIRPPNECEFRLYQKLVQQEAGIFLGSHKKAMLVARLSRRLRALGLDNFRAYYHYLAADKSGEERLRMLDCISTNETHFFRHPQQFEFLEQAVIPEWKRAAAAGLRARRIRVWSAACSTGEEPYSLAMSLLAHCPASAGWHLEILASDLSMRALKVAVQAVWPLPTAGVIPSRYRKRFMLEGIRRQAGKMKAGPEIRSVVRFLRLNLMNETYSVSGKFDLIFCRNVLIYFTAESRQRVIRRLLDLLAPGGLLFLGHAESLSGFSANLRNVSRTVYARCDLEADGTDWAGVLS